MKKYSIYLQANYLKRIYENTKLEESPGKGMSNKDLMGKDSRDKSSKKAKYLEMMDYTLAILGSLAILISLYKFIKYLIRRK